MAPMSMREQMRASVSGLSKSTKQAEDQWKDRRGPDLRLGKKSMPLEVQGNEWQGKVWNFEIDM